MDRWDAGEAGWELLPHRWKERIRLLAAVSLVLGFLVFPVQTQLLETRAVNAYIQHKFEPLLKQFTPSTTTTIRP